jgi:hypothetical protein
MTAPVSHQKQPDKPKQTRLKSNENQVKSTNLIDILPLITVWLPVPVLLARHIDDPPAFASIRCHPPNRFSVYGAALAASRFLRER